MAEHRWLRIKTQTDERVASVTEVFAGANWYEREVYDLFGVDFPGHPDLRRIMLPDDWVGHPLRKDYQEAGGWHGISNVRENPLVELKRLDDARRAEVAANAPPPPPPPAAAPKA
jgi:NADH-quinone oxidoreductase subunit C